MRIITICVLISSLSILSVTGRRYFPEEERKNDHRRFVTLADDNGVLHHVDLHQPYDESHIATIEDITVYLNTQSNPGNDTGFLIRADTFDGTVNSPFYDPSKMNVFTVHGWIGTYLSNTNVITRDGILAKNDVNIFTVDYSRPAGEFYTQAVLSVPVVGKFMADFINKMMDVYNMPSSNFMLVGQSLGGQVIGVIGTNMNGLAHSIIALDASGVLFYVDEPENCLDPTDASFVHAIHTNGGFLGMRSSIGHADYFPNGGGLDQPGCGVDIAGSCAHYRAYWYWEETLATGNFRGVRCDSYENFKAGLCDGNAESFMGQYPVDLTAAGDYFLDTAAESPYALG